MKRPLMLYCISLICGILVGQLTRSIPFVLVSAAILLVNSWMIFWKTSRQYKLVVGILLFYCVGALEFIIITDINHAKYKEYAGSTVLIKGFVSSEPDIRETKVNYTIKTDTVTILEDSKPSREETVKGKILLSVPKKGGNYLFEYGNSIQIKGRINLPKGASNPGGFDFRDYLTQSGISATIFATSDQYTLGTENGGNVVVKLGLALRKSIVEVINKSLPKRQAGLLNGMLIGYKQGLDEEVKNAFSDSGLSHIMAVSGANVAFIIFPLVFLFKKLRMKERLSNAIIILILMVFVFITGFEPSVLRAVIMAVVILVGKILRRDTEVFTTISFAAILLLLYNPHNLFNIGFQLSFGATLSLVLFYKNIREFFDFKRVPSLLLDTFAATLAAQFGVLPITVYYFNKVSLISIASNILVVPVLEGITILGSLMALLGQVHIFLSQVLGYVNVTLLSFVLFISETSAKMPLATAKVPTPSIYIIIIYYIVIMFFLWYKPLYKVKLKPRYYLAASSIAMIVIFISIVYPKDLKVVFLDVGQGDSAFIRTSSGKTVLIDGGGFSSMLDKDSSMGEMMIAPFLFDQGVMKLDMVIATHAHDDHIHGLKFILEEFGTHHLIIPETKRGEKDFSSILNIAKSKNIKITQCKTKDIIQLDAKTRFEVLHPLKDSQIEDTTLNNTSLVVKLNYQKVRFLFTGDMEAEAEDVLLEKDINVKADVLKVAHHGSDTSTTEGFLRAVNPSIAVISVGGKNNFGHPSKTVLQRLQKDEIHIYRTDLDGAVTIDTNGEKLKIKKQFD